jgi:hypothetical protein
VGHVVRKVAAWGHAPPPLNTGPVVPAELTPLRGSSPVNAASTLLTSQRSRGFPVLGSGCSKVKVCPDAAATRIRPTAVAGDAAGAAAGNYSGA